MAVRKIKGSWWVDFMYQSERLRRRSPSNTKAGAEAFEVHLRQTVATHGSVKTALAALTFRDEAMPVTFAVFAERWQREYVAVNNKPSERYTKQIVLRTHLVPMFGQLPLSAITLAKVDQFKQRALERGLAPKSVNNYLTILRKCLSTAVEWEVLAVVPRIRLLKVATPGFRYLSDAEVAALVTAAYGVWRDMILVGARTGLRFSEMSALDWSDLDLRNGLLTVRHGRVLGQVSSPKNNRIRHVPLTADVRAALAPRQTATGLVFENAGRPVAPQTASVRLHAICERAGIKPHGWHVLRHTFASHLAQRGASLQAIKELLGHSSLTMVLRYAHLAPEYLAQTIRLLDAAPPLRFTAARCQPESNSRLPEPQPELMRQAISGLT